MPNSPAPEGAARATLTAENRDWIVEHATEFAASTNPIIRDLANSVLDYEHTLRASLGGEPTPPAGSKTLAEALDSIRAILTPEDKASIDAYLTTRTAPAGAGTPPGSKELLDDLASAINRHSIENESNTPDFILADFLRGCLSAFAAATRARRDWYGDKMRAAEGIILSTESAPLSGESREAGLDIEDVRALNRAAAVLTIGLSLTRAEAQNAAERLSRLAGNPLLSVPRAPTPGEET